MSMPSDRTRTRRAFRPTVDGRLEDRALLAAVVGPQTRLLPGFVTGFTANSGRAVVLTDVDGERYRVSVIGGGTVRARPQGRGQVSLIVDGTNDLSTLSIDQLGPVRSANSAHTFFTGQALQDGLLHVNSINVRSGKISGIFGYRTADLSGSIRVAGPGPVDRIAFSALRPGASIQVGGDLNTLDVSNEINLTTGPGIVVGRDLNSVSIGRELGLTGGASIAVGRDLGLNGQPAKGTGPAGRGIFAEGSIIIGPGSSIVIGRDLVGSIVTEGDLIGSSRIFVGRNNSGGVGGRGVVVR